MAYKHKRVWLPLYPNDVAFEANLDELSLQGWDFVAWVSESVEICDDRGYPVGGQRRALVRQELLR